MIREYNVAIHHPGAMSADLNIRWNVPDDTILQHVSGVTSNDCATTIQIGDENTANLHLAAADVGSGTNQVHEYGHQTFSDFATGQHPRILDGDTIVIAVDFDGDAQGDPGEDLTLVLRFAEG
jgi:hypothetical protein